MKKLISLCMMWCICLSIWAGKHYTVIVSLDGFRWDYPQMYDTPFFDRMAREGVKATMVPSFPSKTFPNHYTIATGLVPDHHGIVANTFWDPQRVIGGRDGPGRGLRGPVHGGRLSLSGRRRTC